MNHFSASSSANWRLSCFLAQIVLTLRSDKIFKKAKAMFSIFSCAYCFSFDSCPWETTHWWWDSSRTWRTTRRRSWSWRLAWWRPTTLRTEKKTCPGIWSTTWTALTTASIADAKVRVTCTLEKDYKKYQVDCKSEDYFFSIIRSAV